MSYIDPFSEIAWAQLGFAQLSQASAPLNGAVASATIAAEVGEFSYDVFYLNPAGAGTAPGLRFQGQVSNDFVNYQNVEGMVFDWLPSQGDGFGLWGVRVANYRLPSVRKGGLATATDKARQVRRWIVTEIEADAGSWTLDRFFTSLQVHKGSYPEEIGFDFAPGSKNRLKLDFT